MSKITRITFQCSAVSDLDPEVILENIFMELYESKYATINRTKYSIEFEPRAESGWGQCRVQLDKVDGGKFEIDTSGKQTIVNLSYYESITVPVVMVVFLLIPCLFQIYPALYLITGILMVTFFKTLNTKSTGNMMLKKITGKA